MAGLSLSLGLLLALTGNPESDTMGTSSSTVAGDRVRSSPARQGTTSSVQPLSTPESPAPQTSDEGRPPASGGAPKKIEPRRPGGPKGPPRVGLTVSAAPTKGSASAPTNDPWLWSVWMEYGLLNITSIDKQFFGEGGHSLIFVSSLGFARGYQLNRYLTAELGIQGVANFIPYERTGTIGNDADGMPIIVSGNTQFFEIGALGGLRLYYPDKRSTGISAAVLGTGSYVNYAGQGATGFGGQAEFNLNLKASEDTFMEIGIHSRYFDVAFLQNHQNALDPQGSVFWLGLGARVVL